MTDTAYLLSVADSSVVGARTLTVSGGLASVDAGAGSTFNIAPTGTLQALASLSSASGGFVVNNGSGVVNVRTLTSGGAVSPSGGSTLSITNPDGTTGNPVLSVCNDSSVQQVNIIYNSEPSITSSRASLNFIPGPGASITIDDNGTGPTGFSGKTDITIGLDSSSAASPNATYLTATDQTSILPNSSILRAGNNIIFSQGTNSLTINAAASAGATVITYFDQQIDTTFNPIATSIAPNGLAAFTFSAPDSLLLSLLQDGDNGNGYILVQANITYTLLASAALTSSLPFTLPFELTTDVHPLTVPLVGTNTTYYYNSSMVTTPQFNVMKKLNDMAESTATRLQIWIQNPDPVNSMSLANFSSTVTVAYLPNGYS